MSEQHETFQQWALVELFGHQQIAGLVSEQVIGGSSFIRVDVPDQGETKGFTKFFGNGAIYAITPCTEGAARVAVAKLQIRPISPWIVPDQKALPQLENPKTVYTEPEATFPDDYADQDEDDWLGQESEED
jgi:hypothetical protein